MGGLSNDVDSQIHWRVSHSFVERTPVEAELAQLGITKTLFNLYMAAAELGEAPIAEVAARAGMVRTTAYHALQRLEEEGLVEIQDRDGKRIVVAEDPRKFLERGKARLQAIEALVPQMRSVYNRIKGKPQIRFFEGEEGIRTVLWESLAMTGTPKILRGYLSMHELEQTPGLDEVERFLNERVQRGIELKVIRSRHRDVQPIWPTSRAERRELRYAPEGMEISMTTLIFDNCVSLISSRNENYGLIIESEEFATMQRGLFDTVWGVCAASPRTDAA